LLGLIKKGRLRRFGHAEHKDDGSNSNAVLTVEVDGTRPESFEEDWKTWWDSVRKAVKSLSLSQEDTVKEKSTKRDANTWVLAVVRQSRKFSPHRRLVSWGHRTAKI